MPYEIHHYFNGACVSNFEEWPQTIYLYRSGILARQVPAAVQKVTLTGGRVIEFTDAKKAPVDEKHQDDDIFGALVWEGSVAEIIQHEYHVPPTADNIPQMI